ncbi:MAG: erythromycin esterase family protein [Bacteroidales bacterium]
MKNFRIAVFLLLLIACSNRSEGQVRNYTSLYDLSFKLNYTDSAVNMWAQSGALLFPENRDSIYQWTYLSDPEASQNKFNTRFYQQLLIEPSDKDRTSEVSITAGGHRIDTVTLSVIGLSHRQEPLFESVLRFKPEESLSEETKEFILLKNTSLLRLIIDVEGKSDRKTNICFDQIGITIGGKPLDSYPLAELAPVKYDGNGVDLSVINNINMIEAIQNSRILGLGESVHHNEIMQKYIYDVAFNQIEKGLCKLYIYENYLDQLLLFNRYINNEIELDSGSLALIKKQHLEFFERIKSYNKNQAKSERVSIYGMDFRSDTDRAIREIFNYLYLLNKEKKNISVDKLLLSLTEKNWREKSIDFIRYNRDSLSAVVNNEELDLLSHYLNLCGKLPQNKQERTDMRDSLMAVTSQFLINNYLPQSKQAIIYAHAGHITDKQSYFAFNYGNETLGFYLQSAYGKDYLKTVILAGAGSSVLFDPFGELVVKEFAENIEGSLEHAFAESNTRSSFYVSSDDISDRLTYMRYIGNNNIRREFIVLNPAVQFDGMFYIPEAYTKMDIMHNKNESPLKKVNNEAQLYNQRIEELQKRVSANK